MPDSRPSSSFFAKSSEDLRHELRGFPEAALVETLKFQQSGETEVFSRAVLGVLEFYIPKPVEHGLLSLPDETRLKEDLGVDSLSMTEAAFKLEELFDLAIDTSELVGITTLGQMRGYFAKKLEVTAS